MKNFISVIFLSIAFFISANAQLVNADLVVINANVHTIFANQPKVESFAVIGNRIVAVGSNAKIKAFIGRDTQIIDAQGKLIIPGFNDAHVHFMDGGSQLAGVDLRDAKSQQEFATRIKNFAAKLPKARWILGGNWDHENWSPANLPTKDLIDALTSDIPVFVQRLDGHMALANSAALKLAGVNKDTKEVEGGEIVRDKNGNPTGVLKDAAMNYIYRVIPEPTFEERLQSAEAATNYAASLGVTSVQDMSAGTDVGVYQELLRQGKLKTRIYAVSPLSDWQRWQKTGVHYAFGSDMLRVGGLKGFADGSLGSTTAWFYAPYLDAPNNAGLASDEIPKMYERVSGADKASLQLMIHAIGDRANDEIVKIYERVAKENGAKDRRFRIEHAQHLNEDLIKRFASNKIIASMQPYHAIDDGRWAFKRLDEKRLKFTYPFRTLLDNGVNLAFGTDWFVAPLNPLFSVYAAVTRRTFDGKNPNGWLPEQKITVEEAVRAYTVGSSYAEFQEKEKGSISVGKLADFVILSEDIFTINPINIEKVKVLKTIVNGKIVYETK